MVEPRPPWPPPPQAFGVGGAVAGVAAIAITVEPAAQPDVGEPEPGVAEHKPQNPLFQPGPGRPPR